MIALDIKLSPVKIGKVTITPEQIHRLLKSKLLVFHFLTFLWHQVLNYQTLAGVFYILFNRKDLVNKTCGYGAQYVTIWNQVIEQTYFNACLLLDVLEVIQNPKYEEIKIHLKRALPFVFTSVIFPLSILVTLNFWGIYSYYPHVIDEDNVTYTFFPPWVNHGLHSTILILACIEKFMVYRPYPPRFWGSFGLFSVLIAYSITCYIFYVIGGVWPYPLILMMTPWQRITFVIGNCILGYFIIEAGEALNNKIWPQKPQIAVKDSEKKST